MIKNYTIVSGKCQSVFQVFSRCKYIDFNRFRKHTASGKIAFQMHKKILNIRYEAFY